MTNEVAWGLDGLQTVVTPPVDAAPGELGQLRAELARERARRRQAEVALSAVQARAVAAEERATAAEWLVVVLRGELTGGAPEQRRWHWPWQH